MADPDRIQLFLDGDVFAVAGASTNRAKYGNKVLRCYMQNDMKVHPINPRADEIEGLPCYADIASLPEPVHGLSIITPPAVTEDIVHDAIEAGIRHIWMQPGAESAEAVATCMKAGVNVIANGPCLLVVLGYQEH